MPRFGFFNINIQAFTLNPCNKVFRAFWIQILSVILAPKHIFYIFLSLTFPELLWKLNSSSMDVALSALILDWVFYRGTRPEVSEVDPQKWPIERDIRDWQTYKKFRIILKQSKSISRMSPKKVRKISHPELEISIYWHNFSKKVS